MTEPIVPINDVPATPAKKRRGRKPGQVESKQRADLTEHLNFRAPAATEKANLKKQRKGTGEDQKQLNIVVAELYIEWEEAGRPANWADMPVRVWEGPAELAEDMIFKLRRAATANGRRLVVGNQEYEDGQATFAFTVIARRVTKPKPPAETTETSD